MGGNIHLRFILAAMIISQSLLLAIPSAEANLVNTNATSHQVSAQSTYAEFSGASSSTGYQPADLDEAYDGDTSTASFGRIRTYACENFGNGPACTTGSFGEVEFKIQTSLQTSSSFTMDFHHQLVLSCTTTPKVTFHIWNLQTASWTQMDSQTGTGGYDVNITYSSDYMSSSGEISVKWRAESGCSSDYIISRLYEFQVYAPDSDGDGVTDSLDDCPTGDTGWSSGSSSDYDSDGCHDFTEDDDDDNDGVEDDLDHCQKGHLDWISGSLSDHDGDGCNDVEEDTDDDNDTITDNDDYCSTGLLFISDSSTDYDSDGCEDVSEDSDDDNDTVVDGNDDCEKGTLGWISDISTDNDGDGCRDSDEDDDDDNDGYNDTVESDCQSDSLDPQSVPTNSDGTGDCDYVDDDDDDDGTPDVEDDFPFDPVEDTDTDGDGIGDNADLDDDWDSFVDTYEESCGSDPLNNTSVPLNFDGDQLCDALDDDDDDDGYNDSIDLFPFNALEWADFDGDGTGDEEDSDDDNDGASDTYEAGCGTLPNDNSSVPGDLDSDGQCDGMDMDDDGDGWSDTLEDSCGFNSMSNASTPPDMDGDGQCDVLDNDIDGDGFTNDEESDCGTNELDNTSLCQDSLPTDPENQNNNSNQNSGNNVTNGTSDDGNEISDSDSKKEDTNDETLITLPSILAILFLILVVSAIILFNRREADEKVADAEQREMLERQRGNELQGRLTDIAEKAVTSKLGDSNLQLQNQLIGDKLQDLEGVIESKLEGPEKFLAACFGYIKHDLPIPDDEHRWARGTPSNQKIEVNIRIGATYVPDLCSESKAGYYLSQCILHFFNNCGGAANCLLGGYSPEQESSIYLENAIELSTFMSYSELFDCIQDIKEVCIWACKNLQQEAVFVSFDDTRESLNPLNRLQRKELRKEIGDSKPKRFEKPVTVQGLSTYKGEDIGLYLRFAED